MEEQAARRRCKQKDKAEMKHQIRIQIAAAKEAEAGTEAAAEEARGGNSRAAVNEEAASQNRRRCKRSSSSSRCDSGASRRFPFALI